MKKVSHQSLASSPFKPVQAFPISEKDEKYLLISRTIDGIGKPSAKKSQPIVSNLAKDFQFQKLNQTKVVRESSSTNRHALLDGSSNSKQNPIQLEEEKLPVENPHINIPSPAISNKVSLIKQIVKQQIEHQERKRARREKAIGVSEQIKAYVNDSINELRKIIHILSEKVQLDNIENLRRSEQILASINGQVEEVRSHHRSQIKKLGEENMEMFKNLVQESNKTFMRERKNYEAEILKYSTELVELESFKQECLMRLSGLEVKICQQTDQQKTNLVDFQALKIRSENQWTRYQLTLSNLNGIMEEINAEVCKRNREIQSTIQSLREKDQEELKNLKQKVAKVSDQVGQSLGVMEKINQVIEKDRVNSKQSWSNFDQKFQTLEAHNLRVTQQIEELQTNLAEATTCFNQNFAYLEENRHEVETALLDTIRILDGFTKRELQMQSDNRTPSLIDSTIDKFNQIIKQHQKNIFLFQEQQNSHTSELSELRQQIKINSLSRKRHLVNISESETNELETSCSQEFMPAECISITDKNPRKSRKKKIALSEQMLDTLDEETLMKSTLD